MPQRTAMPFLVLDDTSVIRSPWLLSLNGQDILESPHILRGWDYSSDLKLSRTLKIDFALASEQLDLAPQEIEVDVIISTGTGQGNIPRQSRTTKVGHLCTDNPALEIELAPNSDQLSGRLKLSTRLVLARPARGRMGALSPSRSGMRLWEDQHDIQLEGDAPRFPVEAVSFRQYFAGRSQESAMWFLHWAGQDLDSDLTAAIRLFINRDQKDFFERVQKLDTITLQTIMADVMSQITSRVLQSGTSEQDLISTAPGTLGQQVWKWLQLAFPDQPLVQIRTMLEFRSGEFHAAIQAAAEVSQEASP